MNGRCDLHGCTGGALAVIENRAGERLEVCARHGHAARERGYKVLGSDAAGEED